MKRYIILIITSLWSLCISAQDSCNVVFYCEPNDIIYSKQEEPSSVKDVANGAWGVLNLINLIGGNDYETNDWEDMPKYNDKVANAIINAITCTRRLKNHSCEFPYSDKDVLLMDITTTTFKGAKKTEVYKHKDDSRPYRGKEEIITYGSKIICTVVLRDKITGKELFREKIKSRSSRCKTQDEAFSNAADDIKEKCVKLLNAAFPLYASIIEKTKESKSKIKRVRINVGKEWNCKEGMHFDVYTVEKLDSIESQSQIATLKIFDVWDRDTIFCNVTHGGKELKTAIDARKKIIVRSRE